MLFTTVAAVPPLRVLYKYAGSGTGLGVKLIVKTLPDLLLCSNSAKAVFSLSPSDIN